jgi:hypothetical protein
MNVNPIDIAEARHQEGYSCSQSVFSALAELWKIDPAVSLRIDAGFGGGLARSGRTCGCVTGAIMAIGLAQHGITRRRTDPRRKSVLWEPQPAPDWNEAYPIGNGPLGAMAFGGIEMERLSLNEDTLYSVRAWPSRTAARYNEAVR